MRLERLVLDNFRCFQRLELRPESDLTVVVGVNGSGKTSILAGIAQLFGAFPQALPNVSGLGLSESDLRIGENNKTAPALRLWGEWSIEPEYAAQPYELKTGSHFAVSRTKVRDSTLATKAEFQKHWPAPGALGIKPWQQLASNVVTAENEGEAYLLPLMVYYGTSRAVFDTPLRRRNFPTAFERFSALEGALTAQTDFKRVFEWFHHQENLEAREQKRRKSFEWQDAGLETVRHALKMCFPEFDNPRTELKPLRFMFDKVQDDERRTSLSLEQLSDGYRTMVALVCDLAYRMVVANPPEDGFDSLQTAAVVLIDEVDLHLHPGWQQRILPDLQRVFPQVQWIVTTHSPQVLSSVEARCIRILEHSDGQHSLRVPGFALGAKSGQLLEDIQGVNPRPEVPIVQTLREYQKLIELDEWDKPQARKLRQELDTWGAGYEGELQKMDIDIKVRALRRRQK